MKIVGSWYWESGKTFNEKFKPCLWQWGCDKGAVGPDIPPRRHNDPAKFNVDPKDHNSPFWPSEVLAISQISVYEYFMSSYHLESGYWQKVWRVDFILHDFRWYSKVEVYLIGRGGGEAGRIAGYRSGWTAFPEETIGCSRIIPKRFPLGLSKHPKGRTGLHVHLVSPSVRKYHFFGERVKSAQRYVGNVYTGRRPIICGPDSKASKLLFS